jgi:general secretion pathway protein A
LKRSLPCSPGSRKGITVITGEPGTGKTTLIHALLKDVSEKIKPAFVFHTTIQFPDLLQEILTELGIPVSDHHLPNLLALFGQHLKERMAQDETVAIVVDESQNLEIEAIASLLGLHHRESPAGKLVQIILAGQTELEAKLDSPELQSFKEIIANRRRIRPLNSRECEEYIDHRLRVVGSSSSEIFTPEAVRLIGRSSGGIPRIINVLCDNALIAGSTLRPKIDEQIAAKAIREMGYLQSQPLKTPPENIRPDFLRHIQKSLQDVCELSIFRPPDWRPKRRPIWIIVIWMVIFFGCGVLYFLDGGRKAQFSGGRKELASEKPAGRTVPVKKGRTFLPWQNSIIMPSTPPSWTSSLNSTLRSST